MIDEKSMNETYSKLLHQDRRIIISMLGTPDISYSAFSAYKRNHLWIVLFFQDMKQGDSFKSVLRSVTFYNDKLQLLWSNGIQLFENAGETLINHPSSVREFLSKYGTPHTQIGGMISALQYLTNDGRILVVKYHHDEIIGLELIKLPDLTSLK